MYSSCVSNTKNKHSSMIKVPYPYIVQIFELNWPFLILQIVTFYFITGFLVFFEVAEFMLIARSISIT